MDRRVALAVAVALATVLAGCSWVESADPGGPQPVNTTNESDERGIPYDRLAAHSDALRDRGYELRVDVRIETPDGTTNQSVAVVSDPTTERQLIRSAATNGTLSRYVNGTRLYTRYVSNGTTRYGTSDLRARNVTFTSTEGGQIAFVNTVHGSSLRLRRLRTIYAFGKFEPDGNVTRNGDRYATFALTDVATGPNAAVTLDHASGRIVIGPDGVIRNATIDVRGTQRGERFVYAVDYRITTVGDVTVQAPEWLDEALAGGNATPDPAGRAAQTTSVSG